MKIIHKTRLAPTPSGFLHLGNAFSFLLTQQLAKAWNAEILVRIDDMDRERFRPEYLENIFEVLRFLEIEWQHGPKNGNDFETNYSQHHRLPLYKKMFEKLKALNAVYPCRCSRKDVAENTQLGVFNDPCLLHPPDTNSVSVVWRLKINTNLNIQMQRYSNSVWEGCVPTEMYSTVIWKKDGLPAYQLCSLADDVFFGITHVVRGNDLWNSSIVQLYMANILKLNSFSSVVFYHHDLIKTIDGNKLSKSNRDSSLKTFISKGFTKKELMKFLPGLKI